MKTSWIIRTENPTDYSQIREMTIAAFKAAYGTGEIEADLVEALRALPDYDPAVSLVAVCCDLVVGHIMLSPAMICGEDGNRRWPALCVAPLGVRIGYQRQGIGSALMQAALSRAKEQGHTRIVLSGSVDYYSRFGFEDAMLYAVRDDLGTPSPHFMVLALVQGAFEGVSGVVRYSSAFDRFRQMDTLPPEQAPTADE